MDHFLYTFFISSATITSHILFWKPVGDSEVLASFFYKIYTFFIECAMKFDQ